MEEFEFIEDDDCEYEYVSEEDVAEENGCFIDDDGNWIPMDEDMEDALYEAREHVAWVNRLKKKYANGKPVPAPKEKWQEIINEWKKTDEAQAPWFHLHIWPGEADPECVETMRTALRAHHFDFDEQEDEWGEDTAWVDSPMKVLLSDYTAGKENEILDTVTIVDGVPYRDGLPAPVYAQYMDELEEYSWIPEPHVREYDVHVNSIGELEYSAKYRMDTNSDMDTTDQEGLLDEDDSTELPF